MKLRSTLPLSCHIGYSVSALVGVSMLCSVKWYCCALFGFVCSVLRGTRLLEMYRPVISKYGQWDFHSSPQVGMGIIISISRSSVNPADESVEYSQTKSSVHPGQVQCLQRTRSAMGV